MTPLAQALQVSLLSNCNDGSSVYRCELDRSWTVGAVPQGGYSLGIIVEACIKHQVGSSRHVDPIHISAHFLRATNVGGGEVRVKALKTGKTFSNILAELAQQGNTKIIAHLIFGDLSPLQNSQVRKVLEPPSPYARRLPLHSHPSELSFDATKQYWARNMGVQMSTDISLLTHNDPDNPLRTTSKTVGGGGIQWGAWCELTHKNDEIRTSSLPFFCDTFMNLPNLLPDGEAGSSGRQGSWFPTITMIVEFKARIPSCDDYSHRTFGLYSESRFLTEPYGRHNARVEVWTAPSQIGQGEVTEGWRDKQYCIAVADQMALMLPMELNIREGNRDSAKL
ncbi:hypothetical protein PAXRUDRAFT_823502 [Paxillus rubicundulus Ve08.2h10]|uniref:Acyl-CoA thioesterase-like N-terminal HotDog domain-containing protein n=1 Tax=Paxillus rubicundulus Ve08.2h10 TaxID=930991 RepID=A0A0D0E8T1_9AGAM|nr:hypothetical protein PAXRUDRAFT_823502 [Paxillus rubicundulus Ve08.2h10]